MTTEQIDALVDWARSLSRDELLAEVLPRHRELFGDKSADAMAKADDLELRWRAVVGKAHEPYKMDPAGRTAANRELDAAGLQWPYPPGNTPASRAAHRLA